MQYVVLLRGVNVGGHNKLPMADLRWRLSDEGFADVRSYLQSGNVILTTETGRRSDLADSVSSIIRSGFGLEIVSIVRDGAEFRSLLTANPYLAEAEADPTKVHVMFHEDLPSGEIDWPEAAEFSPDDYTPGPGCVFIHLPNGAARTKLIGALEKAIPAVVTSRNWRTVARLTEMVTGAPDESVEKET